MPAPQVAQMNWSGKPTAISGLRPPRVLVGAEVQHHREQEERNHAAISLLLSSVPCALMAFAILPTDCVAAKTDSAQNASTSV